MKGDIFFEQISQNPRFSKIHPKVATFFRGYLANEKVIKFNDRFVMNTHFPPYPSRAFDNLVEHFNLFGNISERRLFSVTIAVTNRCNYRCWHCYNAGRAKLDMSLPTLRILVAQIQRLGAVHVTLTGGEPLLRADLEAVASSFDNRTYLTLNTTGDGLTNSRARSLRDSGIFAVGISLDSTDPDEHDQLRGKKGAFGTSIKALRILSQNDLYPYIIAVATHDFLAPERFWDFMRFASEAGALEVHLLEPSATGRLAGRSDVLLKKADIDLIFKYQKEVARDDKLPILSSFLYLESPHAFGCGAGLTHMYVDGSGEVCPCNLIPISFGNITKEPFHDILNSMGQYFQKPRISCVGKVLSKHIQCDELPTRTEESIKICNLYLPKKHKLPKFFRVRSEAQGKVGNKELQYAYDRIHKYYNEFWLKEAGKPIESLVKKLTLEGSEFVFEAGCGTGFATALIANKLIDSAHLTAVDISEGMLSEARRRVGSGGIKNIRFIAGDALAILGSGELFDLIFSSWVLGYIPLKPFFEKAFEALNKGGRMAFIVHKENSPYELLEIFKELISKDPSILKRQIDLDFPQDNDHLCDELKSVGFEVELLLEDKVVFQYNRPEEVTEHLLKSGAGTVYYNNLDPGKIESFEDAFIKSLIERHKPDEHFEVVHDYISCIARKPITSPKKS